MFNNEKNLCLQKHTDSNSKKWIGLCAKCPTWVDSDHKNIRNSKEGGAEDTLIKVTAESLAFLHKHADLCYLSSRLLPSLSHLCVHTLFLPTSLSHISLLISSSIHAERLWRKHQFLDNQYPCPSVALLLLFYFTSSYGCWCLPPYLPAQPWSRKFLGELRAPGGQEPHVTRCHKLEDTEPSSEGTQCNESHKLTSTQILIEVRFEERGEGPWNRNRQVGCGELGAHTLGVASGVPHKVEGDNVGDEA